ncbi:tetratricopeptide repeat protein [Plantactinospora sp. B6F1]|uniref:AfsR/SARP family transcriptional regulator n=1 Tax=Plantactinospora sp. B6F1 TaxID=3158971 RepID=UPI0032D96116
MADLRVAVLGPLWIQRHGNLVGMGPKLAALFSVLLIEVDRIVPASRLVELLWEGSRPYRARSTLRSHISHLRQALQTERGDGAMVTTSGSGASVGYSLRIPLDRIDSHRFERLCGEGRRLLGEGDQEQVGRAAELLRMALALWRGPAYADIAHHPFAIPETSRLDAMRRSARRDLADALSTLGQVDQAIVHLTAALGDDPYDEGMRRSLATALYAEQRIDEAAEVCRQGLALLYERGIDAPELQNLQRDILRRQVSLAPKPQQREPTAVPRLLPPEPPYFVGRVAELESIQRRLCGPADPQILIVTGPAGIGKTSLAVRLAHTLAADYPDGQLYVNLRGFGPTGLAMRPDEALRLFLEVLGVSPERMPVTAEAQTALYRSLVAGRRMLVVLDNAHDAAQVRPLLPGSTTCPTLVTSRDQLPSLITADGAHLVGLNVFTPTAAGRLLSRRIGSKRIAAEPEAVPEIIASCAGLPLALTIVSARAASHPHFSLRALADEIRAAQGGLHAFASGDAAADARSVFSWSYRRLSAGAGRLFELLGLCTTPEIDAPAAASLAALPVAEARSLLAELARTHLLQERIPGRYACHDLLRAYARELVAERPGDEEHAAMGRLFDHYLHTAAAADRLLRTSREPIALPTPRPGLAQVSFEDEVEALAWFATEHAVLMAVVGQAERAGFDGHVWRIAWTLANFFDHRGHWHDWATTHEAAVVAARREGDRLAEAEAYRTLGSAYIRLRRFQEAESQYRHALDLFVAVDDRVGQAFTHRSLGWLHEQQGRVDEALRYDLRALGLFRQAGHRAGHASSLNSVGWCYALLGDHKHAIRHCRQALELLRTMDNRAGEAATWDSLGYAHLIAGDGHAVDSYARAVDLYRKIGHRSNEAISLTHLGDAHDRAGSRAAARVAWQQALSILQELDHPEADQVRRRLHLARRGPATVESKPAVPGAGTRSAT